MATKYDAAVIGAGPGGYIAAIRLAQLGLKTVCIDEALSLGGTCLNVGCIPSKTLLHASELFMRLKTLSASDFEAMMSKKDEVVEGLAKGVQSLMKKYHIDVVTAHAKVTGPHTVQVGEKEIEAKSIVLATGAIPIPLPFLPFDEKTVLSSTGALGLDRLPKKMIVVGGGVTGVELASVYSRLGTEVIVVELLPSICTGFDSQLSKMLLTYLKQQNIQFMLNSQVISGKHVEGGIELGVRSQSGKEELLQADVVLVTIGRRPNSLNLGLDALRIDLTNRGSVIVDDNFRTAMPSIYAIGDLIDGPMLAHRASYEGVAVAEEIAGKPHKLDYTTIPSVIYTTPELAAVGLSEDAAIELGRPLLIGQCPFKANPRARSTNQIDGRVLIVADKQTERILGIHILANHASEMIGIGSLALFKRLTLTELGDLPFAHPTFSEAIKEAALQALGRSYHL